MRTFLLLSLMIFCPLLLKAEQSLEINRFLASREVVGEVFFAYKTTELSTAAKQNIDKFVGVLLNYQQQGRLLRIEGFASPEGSKQSNSKLSLERALAVKDYLAEQHKLQVDVFLTGFGETEPAAGTLTGSRRVDIAVYEMTPAAKALFEETGQIERYDLQ